MEICTSVMAAAEDATGPEICIPPPPIVAPLDGYEKETVTCAAALTINNDAKSKSFFILKNSLCFMLYTNATRCWFEDR
jgi:hypothetical protein